jgi:endogenous inhibitor of DNA gyrase (YacG/DUF329 family)
MSAQAERSCAHCGASLAGRRSDARYCSGGCRAADSQRRRSEARTGAKVDLRALAEARFGLRDERFPHTGG